MTRKFAITFVALLCLTSCQTSSFNALRLPRDDCEALRTWAEATTAERMPHRIGFAWISEPNSISLRASMFVSRVNGEDCSLSDADRALYEAVGYRTHYVGLDDFARSMSRCLKGEGELSHDDGGSVISVSSKVEIRDFILQINWDEDACVFEDEPRLAYPRCLSLEMITR